MRSLLAFVGGVVLFSVLAVVGLWYVGVLQVNAEVSVAPVNWKLNAIQCDCAKTGECNCANKGCKCGDGCVHGNECPGQ